MLSNRRTLAAFAAVLLFAALGTGGSALAQRAPATEILPEAAGAIADAHVFCNGIRRGDEIVVVNSRMLGCNCDPESIRTGLRFETYSVCDEAGFRRWRPSDLESFLASDPSVPTLFFIHGNQISPGEAKGQGLTVYRRMVCYGGNAPPIRFVIFSWPSSKVGGLLRDVQVKAMRTDPAGCQLAWLMSQMPPEAPVSLVGFSYGARIITAGLHILAGGNLGRLCLAEGPSTPRAPVNVVLMASALHAHWLCPGRYHGLAMTQVNQMLLVNNCSDPAMQFYHLAFPGQGHPQALGLCGPTCISPQERFKIRMRDVSGSVGSRHELMLYLCAGGIAGQIWETTVAVPTLQLQAAM